MFWLSKYLNYLMPTKFYLYVGLLQLRLTKMLIQIGRYYLTCQYHFLGFFHSFSFSYSLGCSRAEKLLGCKLQLSLVQQKKSYTICSLHVGCSCCWFAAAAAASALCTSPYMFWLSKYLNYLMTSIFCLFVGLLLLRLTKRVIQIGRYYLTRQYHFLGLFHTNNSVIFINTFYWTSDFLCLGHIGGILPLPRPLFSNTGESIELSSSMHKS